LRIYSTAMDDVEYLYRTGLLAESKSSVMAKGTTLYRHAAFAAVRNGRTAEALFILERGKTRLLSEALRLRIPRPNNVPNQAAEEFERAVTLARVARARGIAIASEERNFAQSFTT